MHRNNGFGMPALLIMLAGALPLPAAASSATAGRQTAADTWIQVPGIAVAPSRGFFSLVATDAGTMYATVLSESSVYPVDLYKFSFSENTWTTIPLGPPALFGSADLAFIPGAAPGTGTLILAFIGKKFHAFDIESGVLTALPDPPTVGWYGNYYDSQGAIVGTDTKAYAVVKMGGLDHFLKLDLSGAPAWTDLGFTPGYMNSWSFSMAWPSGGNFIYATGGDGQHLWRYDLARNEWISSENSLELDALPQPVEAQGGALAADDRGFLHCFIGYRAGYQGDARAFYRYDVARKLWMRMADAPGDVTDYACFASPPGPYLYAVPGYGHPMSNVWRYSKEEARPTAEDLTQTTVHGVVILQGEPIDSLPRDTERSFMVQARVGSPDPLMPEVRLQLQVVETGIAGAVVTDVTGEKVPVRSTVSVTVEGLRFGQGYRWQVRVFDAAGLASAWIPFGSVALDEIDVLCPPNNAPVATANAMEQIEGTSGRALPPGAATLDRQLVFRVPSPVDLEDDSLRLEVEVKPAGSPFSGDPSVQGPLVASGDVAWAAVEPAQGAQSWRGRLVDGYGLAGAWMEFGANGSRPDFVFTGGSLGNKPCLGSALDNRMSLIFLGLAALAGLMFRRGGPAVAAIVALSSTAAASTFAPIGGATVDRQSGPDTWSDPSLPRAAGAGCAAVATGPDTFYMAFGNNTADFYKCSLSPTLTWTPMAPVPEAVDIGGNMTFFAGSNSIYLVPSGTRVRRAPILLYRYDLDQNVWSANDPLPAEPETVCGFAATASKAYLLVPGGFFEFDPSKAAGSRWSPPLAAPPTSYLPYGLALAWPGSGDFQYALRGNYERDFWRYSIASNAWVSSKDSPSIVAPLPDGAGPGSVMIPGPGGSLYCSAGDWATGFHRYDPPANAWTPLAATPARMSGYGAMAWVPGSATDIVHIVRGAWFPGTTDFWRYSISGNRFLTGLPPFPGLVDTGGCLTVAGNGNDLYALRGNGTAEFHRFSISSGEWTRLEDTPAALGGGGVPGGGSLAHDGEDSIYATQGGGKSTFWRYSISGRAWSDARPLPAPMGTGGAIVHVGGRIIHGIRGHAPDQPGWSPHPTTQIYRYDAAADEWVEKAPLPGTTAFDVNSALTCEPSGGTLYALASRGSPVFLGYSISGDTWSTLAVPPVTATGVGASLCHSGTGRYIYALPGGQSRKLLAYSTADGAWTDQADAPGMIGSANPTYGTGGASLVYPGGGPNLYALQGNQSGVLWRYEMHNTPPAPPAGLSQFRLDGAMSLSQGGVTPEAGFVAAAIISDPDHDSVRLHVEAREIGVDFSGVATAISDFVPSGGIASVTVTLQLDRAFHWQAWTGDGRDASSTAVSRGGNPEDPSEVDLRTKSDLPPALSSPEQASSSTGAPLVAGGTVIDGRVTFRATLNDPDVADEVMLEIEVRPVGAAFTGEATVAASFGLNGRVAKADVELPQGAYRWSARAVDHLLTAGPWSEFGSGGASVADFVVPPGGSEGGGCLHSARPHSAAAWTLMAAILVACRRGRIA